MVGAKPGAGIRLQAGAIDRGPRGLSMCNRAQTDANGNFTMERVVPGNVGIERMVDEQAGSSTMTFFAEVGTVLVTEGRTTTVDFGGVGRPVAGKFIFPPEMNSADFFIDARAIPLGDNPTGPGAYFLEVDGQHNFRINNVVPGEYRIHVLVEKVRGERTAQPSEVKFTMPDVPGGVSEEPLVIPNIQLRRNTF